MPFGSRRPAIVRHARPLAAAAAILTAAASLTGPSTLGLSTTSTGTVAPGVASPSAATNVVVEWNRTLLSLVQATGLQPATIQPTRDFALMSAAVYDAVDAIDPVGPQYLLHLSAPRRASRRAAAAQAAHDVLSAAFPSFAGALDAQLATDLATIPPSRARTAGIRVGARAASRLLLTRQHDGSGTPPPRYRSTGAAGDYRRTPPDFAAPVFTHWAAVTPFTLRNGHQFRPPPPAALHSRRYAKALNQVKRLGRDTSTIRTPEQTTIANFWSAPIQNYWNSIAAGVTLAHHDDIAASARTFALLDLGLADATIAMYDAKYRYRVWRPITAIRHAGVDRNPWTRRAARWKPLATTPPDPSYPGAHSTISATAATILTSLYGTHAELKVTSPTMPGVTRTFHRFGAVVAEAGRSRIYAGVHTRVDDLAGRQLGYRVGRYILRRALDRPVPSPSRW